MTVPTPDPTYPAPWLAAFFTASTAALAIFDSQLRFVRVNRVLADLSGLSPEEHVGRPLQNVFPVMADRLAPLLRHVVDTGEALLDLEVSGETTARPGEIRTWNVSYFPLSLGAGNPPGVGGVAVEVTAHKQTEHELRRSREELRLLANRLAAVREQEAQRIARDVHDTLGQQLTALKLELLFVASGVPDATPEFLERCQRVQYLLDDTIRSAQRISSELRLGHLEIVGLAGSIQWYTREFARRTSVECNTVYLCDVDQIDRESSLAAFRILQEAMTNIARHSGATHVEITLASEGDNVVLGVTDNGRGITPQQLASPGAIGLLGMRERAQAVGGAVVISPAPDRGTIVRATLPKQPRGHG